MRIPALVSGFARESVMGIAVTACAWESGSRGRCRDQDLSFAAADSIFKRSRYPRPSCGRWGSVRHHVGSEPQSRSSGEGGYFIGIGTNARPGSACATRG